MNVAKKNWYNHLLVLSVIFIVINPSLVSALEFSDISVSSITENSAVVNWSTDVPADSFVKYGSNKGSLKEVGDANLLTKHSLGLEELDANTTYYYAVKSNDVEENNSGSFYSFATLLPDIIPPKLVLDLPSIAKGDRVDVKGFTETGALVKLYVNDALAASTAAIASISGKENTSLPDGEFTFAGILIKKNKWNNITLVTLDAAGNYASAGAMILSDANRPALAMSPLPGLRIVVMRFWLMISRCSKEKAFRLSKR
ncbi:fibronectin type III domain-containing protein [Candidatus Woesearchaeota archaeon]|nr:fibronectin type III domain-containing protein [Candidatus Woesearchaeota archaeon]